ncbi:Hypothetical protein CpOVI2C_00812 [Corynebacterium pseudotuberculosis]|nr:Hypothetical protein Cp3995_1855 [Corynebacterium pseudotuberculosis 3/99-5]AQU93538.1 Hypothetical protein CpMIC6_1933 [Corynebacterium pseudotuberculosis]AUY06817.1 Hypothetical protein CpOVI2C_00812 [Corynebacterium pseudotuberculosis]AUY56004.1 Hypothetical protein CpCAP3W_00809 [Corynebacterium pseudotuberculosis]QBF71253.1 Hypothetical protein Cp99MAT_0850 [Corynebacterium pseudotuberculosis]
MENFPTETWLHPPRLRWLAMNHNTEAVTALAKSQTLKNFLIAAQTVIFPV